MTWSPVDLEIVAETNGDLKLERRIHGIFAADHLRREWFKASDPLDALIAGLAAGQSLGELIDLDAPLRPFRLKKDRAPDALRRMSYTMRLWHAFRKHKQYPPHDVAAIIEDWRAWGRRVRILPSIENLQRIEEVLANPRAHAITYEERWGQRQVSP